MNYIEIIAVVCSLLSVWFSVNRNVFTWPTGIAGISAYFILFLNGRMYADMTLQLLFFIQSIYGWYAWFAKKDHTSKVIPDRLTKNKIIICAALVFITWLLVVWILTEFTRSNLPWADAAASTLSLYANWLLARRKIENWVLWILADCIYIGLFIYTEMYLSAVTYVIFLIMATVAFFKWRNTLIKKDSF